MLFPVASCVIATCTLSLLTIDSTAGFNMPEPCEKEHPMSSAWSLRFLTSTRGRLIALLRRDSHTVDDLASALNLTDNAVRAHLASLERDGIVRQCGVRRDGSVGKLAYAYELTTDAEQFFPKPYATVLR